MSCNQHHLHLLATCLFTAATHSQALPLNDKALELYGTLHASLDIWILISASSKPMKATPMRCLPEI